MNSVRTSTSSFKKEQEFSTSWKYQKEPKLKNTITDMKYTRKKKNTRDQQQSRGCRRITQLPGKQSNGKHPS